MPEAPLCRGDIVTVLVYGGERLRRRVWADVGRGVVVCSEAAYQQALRSGELPLVVGFPKEDVQRAPGSEA
jgi:hypothetical protein